MNSQHHHSVLAGVVILSLIVPCPAAQAGELLGYVGPGAGLTMFGALFAVACVLFLALLAPILYPIQLVRAWMRRRRDEPTSLKPQESTPQ